MTPNELKRLKQLSRRAVCVNADLIGPMRQADALIESRPARITVFPDSHSRNAKQFNDYVRPRAARAGITVVELDPEALGDYK